MNINKMNDTLLMGLVNRKIDSYNEEGWQLLSEFSRTYWPQSMEDEIDEVIEDMYVNAISDNPEGIDAENKTFNSLDNILNELKL